MAEKIKLVQGDSLPRVSFTLTDAATMLPIDLSDAILIVLKFRQAGSTTLVSSIPGVITSALGGTVDFLFPSAALAGEAGPYESEIEITHSSGRILTVYDTQKYVVREQF
jgi:hypothetical protein